jgi:hypothetical protein
MVSLCSFPATAAFFVTLYASVTWLPEAAFPATAVVSLRLPAHLGEA